MRTVRPAGLWRGIHAYLVFGLGLVLFVPLLAVVALLHRSDPTCRVRGRWLRNFGRLVPAAAPLWRFRVEGAPPDDIRARAYVVVANHESTADPFLLSLLPWDMRWVAKAELFRLPLVGWLLRLGGDIRLERGQGDSVRAMLQTCRETLARGLPVMLFPEGTRSPNGQLLPFRDGAFELAIQAGVPVLPVALAGTRQCRVPGSSWFAHAEACARVLAPVPTAGLTAADLPALREQVRGRIAAEVAALRMELELDAPAVLAA